MGRGGRDMTGTEEELAEWETEDLIPGDNSKPSPCTNAPNAPDNLTHIPAEGGSGTPLDVPIVLEPNH